MPVAIVLGLAFVSGGLVLAYEVLWTRELLNLLGSTTRASAATLTAFMVGLAIGAWLGGRWTVRARRPLLLYSAAEGLLGVLGLAFPSILGRLGNSSFGSVLGLAPQISQSAWFEFGGLIVLLIVPAMLMGIALPALAATLQHLGASRASHVAWLYGTNTVGAAIGAVAVGFGALPAFGLNASVMGTALMGFVVAGAALVVATRPVIARPRTQSRLRDDEISVARMGAGKVAVVIALFLSGIAALGYQIVWTRILVLVIGSSSNAFTLMLFLYLTGLALGGFWIGRRVDRVGSPDKALQAIQLSVAATALVGLALLGFLPSAVLQGLATFGTAPVSVILVGGAAAAAIILPPTFFIGAALPTGARLLQGSVPRRGHEFGIVLAATTAGNVVGVMATAFGLIPSIGLQSAVAALAIMNVAAALVLWAAAGGETHRRRLAVPMAGIAAILFALLVPSWDVKIMSSGVFRRAPVYLALLGKSGRLQRVFGSYRTVYYREGSEAVVAVFERPTLQGTAHRFLTIDGKVDASTGADMATQVLSGHLPFLFRPNARNALVIGLASGVSVGELLEYPLKKIDVVEIEPAVKEAAAAFAAVNGKAMYDPRVAIRIGDGRRYLRSITRRYDIIVSEPSNPWLSMSARLFTREFFELARRRLRPNGVLVQWVPLYGLSKRQFEALLRTLLTVFPNVALFRVAAGDLVAIAGTAPLSVHPEAFDRLTKGGIFQKNLKRIGLRWPADIMVRYVADQRGLRIVLGSGPLNTDDNAMLEFGSPWYLLEDTRRSNLEIVKQASAQSSFTRNVTERLLAKDNGLRTLLRLARKHLTSGRLELAGGYARALRGQGRVAEADLLLGDIAAAKGRWREAGKIWQRYRSPASLVRLAKLAYRLGKSDEAVRLFSELPVKNLLDADTIVFSLALAASSQPNRAIKLLAKIDDTTLSAPVLVGRHAMAALNETIGKADRAAAARKRLMQGLDELRRCLEVDGCRKIADALLRWARVTPRGIAPEAWGKLRRDLYLRILRPFPHYLRGVSRLWLGDSASASKSFRIYLSLLPERDGKSRANVLIKKANAAFKDQ